MLTLMVPSWERGLTRPRQDVRNLLSKQDAHLWDGRKTSRDQPRGWVGMAEGKKGANNCPEVLPRGCQVHWPREAAGRIPRGTVNGALLLGSHHCPSKCGHKAQGRQHPRLHITHLLPTGCPAEPPGARHLSWSQTSSKATA